MKQTAIYQQILKIMSTNEFVVFMNVVRILLIVFAVGMTIYIITEIKAVKFLNYDACRYCMEKTGARCFVFSGEKIELNLSNLTD